MLGSMPSMSMLLVITVSSPASERKPLRASAVAGSKFDHPTGAMAPSMYAMPATRSSWRYAQSKPNTDPQSWITSVTLSPRSSCS